MKLSSNTTANIYSMIKFIGRKKILLNKKDKQKNSTGSIISNQKVVETPAKTDALTHICDPSPSWLGTLQAGQ